MNEALELLAKAVAVVTLLGFVAMMILYFRSGPCRLADRVMSAAILTAVLVQYGTFLGARDLHPARSIVCLALLVTANGLFWTARSAHGRRRPGAVFGQAVPTEIVRSGPYRAVRHPFYLSYVLSSLALSVAGHRWWLYAISAATFLAYNAAAAQEERLLSASPGTGRAYAEYRGRTWRWCPFVW